MDFFRKGAAMTKEVAGMAKLRGMPEVHPRPMRRISRVGTFFSEKNAVTSILLEVADTDESRRLGLMGREDVPSIYGMLFEGLSGGGYFWMKNCKVPLDIAFMDSEGVITKTYSMPVDEKGENRYEYDGDDVSAVEVEMGFLGEWGIGPGFRLKIRKLTGKEDDDG